VPQGKLYLVPSLLGPSTAEDALAARSIAVARGLSHFVVENAKPARAFLKALGVARPLAEIDLVELGAAPTAERCRALLAPIRAGNDLGLVSDAGCPGVADPGAALVAAAHRERITVVPLVGPSALLLALMASGLNGQGFTFHGYLPVQNADRGHALRRLEAESARTGQAQMFIETPYRNAALLTTIIACCRPQTRLCVAADLTTATESIATRSVRDWQREDPGRYAKRPAIFILQST
jgi:16S rRNA (cytidine1402-2'-O)-methyltransferase